MPNFTSIIAPRVPFLDPRTGLISREWYRFLLNLYELTGGGQSDITVQDLLKGVPVQDLSGEIDKAIQESQLSYESSQEIEPMLYLIKQSLETLPQQQLGTLAAVNEDNVRYLGFNTLPAFTNDALLPAGTVWWDTTGTLNIRMGNGNITQQVGEEFFRYGKASSAISDVNLQAVYKTGVVGASGVITFAPVVAGLTDPDSIIGIATEPIALNGFGRVTTAGVVHGINTTGSVYGEVWADNDDIWYNPVTGGLTKVKPSAPNIKLQLGTVINAGSGGSGSFSVNRGSSSALGNTDSNVQFTALANNDLIVYDSALGYWKNAASTTIPLGTATNADNIKTASVATNADYYPTFVDSNNGVAAYEAVYTDAGISYNPSTNVLTVTGLTVSNTINGSVNGNAATATTADKVANSVTFNNSGTGDASGTTFNGAAAKTISYNTIGAQAAGTYVTSVTGTSPVSSSGGTTPAISLASGYGDTQNPYASKTANYFLAAPNGSAGVPTFRAVVAADIPTLNQDTTGTAAKADTVKTASVATNANYYPTFVDSDNGVAAYESVYTDAGISYNPSTNVLTVTGLTVSNTINGSVNGNAATATTADKVANALTIGTGLSGTSYNGSAAVTIANTGVLSVNGSTGAITNVALTTGTLAQFAATTSAQLAGVISDETGSGPLVFATTPSFTTTIGVGGATASASGSGISFPATQSASTDVNTLDDYEEGSWTVTFYDASSGGNASATTGTGYYTKIGNMVACRFSDLNNIDTTGMTAANVLYFSLPFTAGSTGGSIGSCSTEVFAFGAGRTQINPEVANSVARGRFIVTGTGVANAYLTVAAITSGTSDVERFQLTYFT